MIGNLPEIRIKHGRLLQKAFMQYTAKIPEFNHLLEHEPDRERIRELIKERDDVWKPVEKEILEALTAITKLEFKKNIIDVYMVYAYGGAFSDPLTLGFKTPANEDFIDLLTHELIHVLLTDNTQDINGTSWAKKTYPEITDMGVIFHILVHAVHKELYLKRNRPERLARDIEKCEEFKSYKDAWDIVEKGGSKEILEMFKSDYNLS